MAPLCADSSHHLPTGVMQSHKTFILPDLFQSCVLKDATNPYYLEAGPESRKWVNSFNVFNDRKRAFFVLGSNELLASHTYSYAGYEEFRTICDFINLLFVVDEISDDQCGRGACATGNVFLNAMTDAIWDDGSTLARMTKEFRARLVRRIRPNSMKRFLECCVTYTNCVTREAELRERGEVLDTISYIKLRRENSAIRPCFALAEYALGIDLPEEVHQNPVFSEIHLAAIDHVCWANDAYSYDMEQAKGHRGNNIVSVLMKEKSCSLQEAMDHIGIHCSKLMEIYTSADLRARLPSWGTKVDSEVQRYIDALGHWVVGNLVWSFESQRYFGAQHEEVKKTRIVALRPSGVPELMQSDSESDSE